MTEPCRSEAEGAETAAAAGAVDTTRRLVEERTARCAWCGRPFLRPPGPGRPRRYCRRSCRQREFEARRRAEDEGRTDGELASTRRALDDLDDLLYVLACAVEDVQRDLGGEHDEVDVRRSLEWLMEAALPLVERSRVQRSQVSRSRGGLGGAPGTGGAPGSVTVT